MVILKCQQTLEEISLYHTHKRNI